MKSELYTHLDPVFFERFIKLFMEKPLSLTMQFQMIRIDIVITVIYTAQ